MTREWQNTIYGGYSKRAVKYEYILLYLHRREMANYYGPGRGVGVRGWGGGGGDERVKARPRIQPEKDRRDRGNRQNNGSVKAVSPRHCPATSALHNCCFNCRAWAQSQGQCPLHCCWGTTRSERCPTFAAQLQLPTHDLFWVNLKVQLHLPPLDLLISPGTLRAVKATVTHLESHLSDKSAVSLLESYVKAINKQT